MPCLSPLVVVNPRYIKYAPVPSTEDYKTRRAASRIYANRPDYYIKVPCGRCLSCRKKAASAWLLRLRYEGLRSIEEHHLVPLAVDLDFAPEYYTLACKNPSVFVRNFIDAVRHAPGVRNNPIRFKYFAISEHGRLHGRFHIHALFFSYPGEIRYICHYWKYGRCVVRPISGDKGYEYRVKYLFKEAAESRTLSSKPRKLYTPSEYEARPGRIWCSPGLGAYYIKVCASNHILSPTSIRVEYIDHNNRVKILPRYLRDKIFNEQQLAAIKHAYLITPQGVPTPDNPVYVGNIRCINLDMYFNSLQRFGLPLPRLSCYDVSRNPEYFASYLRYLGKYDDTLFCEVYDSAQRLDPLSY